MSTLDILAMYTSLNREYMAEIANHIDSPSNGIIMQHDWRKDFDEFEICLVPIDHVSSHFSLFLLTKLLIYREIALTLRRNFKQDGLLVSNPVPAKSFSKIILAMEKALNYPDSD
jgi:hypothetical protein